MTRMIHNTACNNLYTGIDLGTTNSVLATVNVKVNGDLVSKVCEIPRPVDIYNTVSAKAKLSTAKKTTLPSCVYYREENNYEPLVGDFAKNQYQLRPHLVAKSIKSQMGNTRATGLSEDVPDKTPAAISSRSVKHLVKAASNTYRTEITDAVITVPANFDSAMCKATRDAAEMAGIRVKNEDGSETILQDYGANTLYACAPTALAGETLRLYARIQGYESNGEVWYDLEIEE